MKKANHNRTEIASIIGVHKSTVGRALSRNRGQRGYRPKQAHQLAAARHLAAYRPRMSAETWARIEKLLRWQWSPEQITGRLRLEHQPAVSHETIYQHLSADNRRGGTLHLCLRSQKKRRQRYGRHSRRGQIPHRVSIEARPAVVAAKRRVGDWEADTIVGAAHRGALLSLVARKSKLVRLCKVERQTAESVAAAGLAL